MNLSLNPHIPPNEPCGLILVLGLNENGTKSVVHNSGYTLESLGESLKIIDALATPHITAL